MPEVALASESKPLSQVERVVDTFVAPSKTYKDIFRSASWWLPCILILLVSVLYAVTVTKKVGIERVTDNWITTMPKIQDTLSSSKPEDAQVIRAKIQKQLSSQFYSGPIAIVICSFLVAGLFLLTANFGFGGSASYKHMLAMFWYSILPLILLSGLVCLLLALNINVESYRITNPVGTNPGYYLPDGTSPVLVAVLSFVDLFSIWVFCLQALGVAIVARISLGKAVASVAIWWVLYSLLKIVPALMFS